MIALYYIGGSLAYLLAGSLVAHAISEIFGEMSEEGFGFTMVAWPVALALAVFVAVPLRFARRKRP